MITQLETPEMMARVAERPLVSSKSRARALLYSLLALAMAAGLFLRLHNLNSFGFWTDELFHVLAARSYLEDGSLSVPAMGQYKRALPITYITAGAFKLWGESEASARLPFALINAALIGGGFLLLRKRFSLGIASFFAVVMCFSPLAITMSRECRMYTLFQSFYFFMSMTFLLGFENAPRIPAYGRRIGLAWERKFEINMRMLALSVPLFLAAVSLQGLAYNFVFVLLAYALTMTVYHLLPGRRSVVIWKYLVLVVLILIGFISLRLYMSDFLTGMIQLATGIPYWSNYAARGNGYYRYFLSDQYPALFFLYPLGALFSVMRFGKRGVFLFLSFSILFLMHSFVFGRKDERYIFYIIPFFFIVSASAAVWILETLAKNMRGSMTLRSRRLRALLAVLALPAVNILAYPWLGNSKKTAFASSHANWKPLPDIIKPENRRAKVLTGNPLSYSYYFGEQPDYYLPIDEDDHSGTGLIQNNAQMMSVLKNVPNLMIITDESKFIKDVYFSEEARRYIEAEFEPVARSGAPAVLVFRKDPARPRISPSKPKGGS